jgi:hypothetical protein
MKAMARAAAIGSAVYACGSIFSGFEVRFASEEEELEARCRLDTINMAARFRRRSGRRKDSVRGAKVDGAEAERRLAFQADEGSVDGESRVVVECRRV